MEKKQQPQKSSLLHKILRNNLLIIGFFVVLIWIFTTLSIGYNTYHREMEKHETVLTEYTNLARETINTAITHSEHIVKSDYILNRLNQPQLSLTEMLEFYGYSEEIMAHTSGVYGTIRILHNNAALYESRRFTLLENHPRASQIKSQLESSKSTVVFIKDSPVSSDVTMYRRIQKNPLCVLEYPILLNNIFHPDYPVSVVLQTDSMAKDKNYFSATLNNNLVCIMKIPRAKVRIAVFQVVLMCLLGLLLLAVLILQISRRTAKNTMQEINDFMESITGETLLYDHKFFHTTYDLYELNIIKKTLQNLALEIRTYSEAVKNAELENKELEMELLSMQLDPHMLYNSLAAIRLDAYHVKHQKIINLIDSMVLYYRNVLKKDRKFVSVEQEMESIRQYLYINELSHEKKYPLKTEIDESLKQFQIPPQILHTFVENCIVHGLSGNRKDCVICIRMTESEGYITTEIFDNGYGISSETLKKLNSGTLEPRHIGVSNALKRLKLVYGEESSVRFDSEKNVYTKVTVRFPRHREEQA